MIATPGAGPTLEAPSEAEGQTWAGIAYGFAAQVASREFRRGDLAHLRRMDPDAPDAAAYWRLMAGRELLGNPAWEAKWALVLHGIVLMTRTSGSGTAGRSAHDGRMPVGQALYVGGDPGRLEVGFYREARLNRLLTAGGPMLRMLLARMFRMMAAADQPFNWGEMAEFILYDGHDEERAERARRRIASDYYQAERRGRQFPESNNG